MAKRDHSRVEALKNAWTGASPSERDEFVVWLGQETKKDLDEVNSTLFSQSEKHTVSSETP